LVIAPREDAGSLSFSDFGLEAELLERKNDFLFDLGEETIPSGVLERGEDLLPNSLLLFIGFFISMPSSIWGDVCVIGWFLMLLIQYSFSFGLDLLIAKLLSCGVKKNEIGRSQ